MKHLKRFENFDLGRFNNEDDNHEWVDDVEEVDDDVYDDEFDELEDEDEIEDEENEMRRKVWGDEVVEKKKTFTYKKSGLKNPKKADLDKDGKISNYEKKRGKAVQKSVQGEKEEKGKEKGLTAAQKKLPEGLRKAIEAKNKKK